MTEPLPVDPGGTEGAPAAKRRRPAGSFFRRLLKEQPLGAVGGLIVLALVFITIFADQLAPYEFDRGRVQERMQGPSVEHLLGTDHVGRDFLSRLLIGARLSITVGLTATVMTLIVALLIGGTTGFIGGRVDIYAQRFVDAWMSFPGLLLLLTIMSITGRGVLQIILVLGITGGIPASRVVRGAVIGIKENDYFQAAKALGASKSRIFFRHVLPNIAAPLIVIFSINVGAVIIAEASLSFLGFGLPANIPSWGGMLSREGRQYMEIAPRLALWPGLCLTVTVYSLNLFGDAMRDLLDPRLRGAQGSYGAAKKKRKRGLLSRLLNPFA
jgi:peptide/nickel transport system permease protein